MKNKNLQNIIRTIGGVLFVICIFLSLLALNKYADVISRYMDAGTTILLKPLENAPLWVIILVLIVFFILFVASLIFYALIIATAQTGTRMTVARPVPWTQDNLHAAILG
jgi:CHASE3 domain sensor protein